MAIDRFIYFNKKVPGIDEMDGIIQDFFSDAGTYIHTYHGDSQIAGGISLPGMGSHPLYNIEDANIPSDIYESDRYIEVVMTLDEECKIKHIDIITRHQDNFTNALAVGLRDVIAGWYGGDKDFEKE